MQSFAQLQFIWPAVLPALAASSEDPLKRRPVGSALSQSDGESVSYRRVEPKYCEGCGALRLRFADDPRVLCRDCESTIGEAALSRRARRSA